MPDSGAAGAHAGESCIDGGSATGGRAASNMGVETATSPKRWTWRSISALVLYVVACLASSALAFVPLLTLLWVSGSLWDMLFGGPRVVPGPPPIVPVLMIAVGWLVGVVVTLVPGIVAFFALRNRLPIGRWWAISLGVVIVIVPTVVELIEPSSPLSIWRVVFL